MYMTNEKTVVARAYLVRRPGHLYFIDKDGDISSVPRAVGHYPGPSGPKLKAVRLGIKKKHGHMYWLERNGDVIERPMARGKKLPA